MPKLKATSTRSQDGVTPSLGNKPRRSRSVCSPEPSNSRRLTTVIDQFTNKNIDSFALSPLCSRLSVLSDKTDIEETRRKSWWKNLHENSRNIMEVLDNDVANSNNTFDKLVEVDVISQEEKSFNFELSDTSVDESVKSIVLPQRKLFTQNDKGTQKKFGQLVGVREIHNISATHDKTIHAGTKNFFQNTQRSKQVFPSALLNVSHNKTVDKTKENIASGSKIQSRNLFASRANNNKNKNIFANFILTESDDEVLDIEPKIFGFQKQAEMQPLIWQDQNTSNEFEDSEAEQMQSENNARQEFDNDMEDNIETEVSNENKVQIVDDQQICVGLIVEDQQICEDQEVISFKNTSQEIMVRKHQNNINDEIVNQDKGHVIKNDNNINQVNKGLDVINKKKYAIDDQNCKYQEINCGDNDITQKHNLEESNDCSRNIDIEIHRTENNENPVRQLIDQCNTSGIKISIQNVNQEVKSKDIEKLHTENNENPVRQLIDQSNTTGIKISVQNVNQEVKSKDIEKLHTENNENPVRQLIDQCNTSDIEISVQNVNQEVKSKDIEKLHTENNENPVRQLIDQCITSGNKMNVQNVNQEVSYVSGAEIDDNQQTGDDPGVDREKLCFNNISRDVFARKNPTNISNETIHQDKDHVANSDDHVNQENVYKGIKYGGNSIAATDTTQRKSYECSHNLEIEKNESSSKENASEEQDDRHIEQANQSQEKESKLKVNIDTEGPNIGVEISSIKNISLKQVYEVHNEEFEVNQCQVDDVENNQIQAIEDDNSEKYVSQGQDITEVDINGSPSEDEVEETEEIEYEMEESENKDDENNENEDYEKSENGDGDNSENEDDEKSENEYDEESENEDDEKIENEIAASEDTAKSDSPENDSEADESQDIENKSRSDKSQSSDNEQDFDDSMHVDEVPTDEINKQNEEAMEVDDRMVEESNENAVEEIVAESPNISHKNKNNIPEAVLDGKTSREESFIAKQRDGSFRKSKSIYKNFNIKQSLAPARDSIGLADGTGGSSLEGSGWDSHRTTRKTLRQTFGKDFTPRKSLRALVMEKSAKLTQNLETLHSETVMLPQANSTEYPDDFNHEDDTTIESDHEESQRERLAALDIKLQKIRQKNLEKKVRLEEETRNFYKTQSARNVQTLFKIPSKPAPRKITTSNKPKTQLTANIFGVLPPEVIEDMKYKPPKRFKPSNASWITKRLYKFLETKLEPKYDYRARVRAEKLVESIYNFTKDLRRQKLASTDSVKILKHEFARLNIVKTHFEFYEFFQQFMPREVRVKVVPDLVNKITLPRHGVFSDIL